MYVLCIRMSIYVLDNLKIIIKKNIYIILFMFCVSVCFPYI